MKLMSQQQGVHAPDNPHFRRAGFLAFDRSVSTLFQPIC